MLRVIALLLVFSASARADWRQPAQLAGADGGAILVETGALTRPETGKPGARSVEVPWMLIPGTAHRDAAPIVFMEGGPGVSTVEWAREHPKLLAELRALGDVLLVDQRGSAGRAAPALDCAEHWALPVDRPVTAAEDTAEARRIFGACAGFWKQAGVDLDGYNTVAFADDVLAVASRLGKEKLRLFGFSYGTQIALTVMARAPERVERAVVAGVMPPGRSLRMPLEHDAVLQRAGLLVGAPDLPKLASAAFARLAATPLPVPGAKDEAGKPVAGLMIDSLSLRTWVLSAMGSRKLLPKLPDTLRKIAAGEAPEPAILDGIAKDVLWHRQGPLHRRVGAQHNAVVCSAGISAADRDEIRREEAQSVLGHAMQDWLPDACDAWGVADLGDAFRTLPPVPVPTLVVAGTIDAKTPLAGAEAVAKRLPQATLLTIEGAGHGELVEGDAAVTEAILRFLDGQPVKATTFALPPLREKTP